jgi:glycine cleavage system H protein
MSDTPEELKYASSHEWVRVEADGTAFVGITDHAQAALGDLVYVELPEVGVELSAGDEAGVVESVKAASDIYAPVSGEVVAVNELLDEAPETVNNEPYNDGWIFQIKMSDAEELDNLMSAEAYQDACDEE